MPDKQASRWEQLCDAVAEDDGLPTRDSGYWAIKKLFAWNRYIEITTTAMVGKPAWGAGVCYVDLFSGPGICTVTSKRSKGKRIPGSPLIAANAPKPFTRILLCEKSSTRADACQQRLEASSASNRYQLFRGDCNELVDSIVSSLPKGSLTLAFLDPTGLHLHFKTVQRLSKHGPVDLLILFPDAVDILRNDRAYYFDLPKSNLDQVLGPDSNWRKRLEALDIEDGKTKRKLYAQIYKDQLQSLAGYDYFAELEISGNSGPLYRLVYATKHPQGIEFWNKSILKEFDGQKRLF